MKKPLTLVLCLINLLWLCSVSAGANNGVSDGDANADGAIDTNDIRLYLKSLATDEAADSIDDLNGDDIVDTLDIRILLEQLITVPLSGDRLFVFETPVNPSIEHDVIERDRVAQIVNTYEEFEAVCAKIRPNFYTPYEGENGSFDDWTQTITPEYFQTKSLFIFAHGTAARDFELDYAVSEETVDITIEQSNLNAFCRFECWHLIVEMDKTDLAGRQMKFRIHSV